MTDEGYNYAAIRMVTGAFADVEFLNYSSYVSDEVNENGTNIRKRLRDVVWDWGTNSAGEPIKPIKEEIDTIGNNYAQSFGYLSFPTLTYGESTYRADYTDEDDGTTYTSYWQAGTEGVAEFLFGTEDGGVEAYSGFVSNALIQYGAYGNFGKHTNGDLYSFSLNQNFYNLENYATTKQWNATEKKVVGIGAYYCNPAGHVYVEDVVATFWVSGMYVPKSPLNGETVKAQIFTFNEDGSRELYAEATANDETATAIGSNGFYTLRFVFTEEDPILGVTEMPIILPDEDFIVIVTGFDKVKAKWSAAFGTADGFTGNAYALLEDDTFDTIGYSNDPSTPQVNLHIGFHAALPVAEPFDDELKLIAPVEGDYLISGYNDDGTPYNSIGVSTLTDPLDEDSPWTIDCSDWIGNGEEGVLVDDRNIDYGYVYFYFSADALPEGMEGREGFVTLSLYGKEITYKVFQGKVESEGINDMKAHHIAANKIFNLAGQKVNANFKGIAIKDGKKVVLK